MGLQKLSRFAILFGKAGVACHGSYSHLPARNQTVSNPRIAVFERRNVTWRWHFGA